MSRHSRPPVVRSLISMSRRSARTCASILHLLCSATSPTPNDPRQPQTKAGDRYRRSSLVRLLRRQMGGNQHSAEREWTRMQRKRRIKPEEEGSTLVRSNGFTAESRPEACATARRRATLWGLPLPCKHSQLILTATINDLKTATEAQRQVLAGGIDDGARAGRSVQPNSATDTVDQTRFRFDSKDKHSREARRWKRTTIRTGGERRKK